MYHSNHPYCDEENELKDRPDFSTHSCHRSDTLLPVPPSRNDGTF